jgi:DNA polymerase-4
VTDLPSAPAADAGPGIVHVDMDAFFVSVELLRRPELRGRPVVVGGRGARGVVAAASYEARAAGVHSAMASARAQRLCPQAVFLPADHARYAEVSARVMAIFERFTPLVEPLSLDEAFLDVRGARRLHGDAPGIARTIRRLVHEETGLTCSVGVAPNKFLAKLASEAAKPRPSPTGPRPGRGVVVVEPGAELAFLHPLPVTALWGVGPATLTKLDRLGVRTVRDLAGVPLAGLCAAVGDAHGRHLHQLAQGIDHRPVVRDQRPKSIGHEETYATDHHRRDTIEPELVRMADAVASRLRRAGLLARTVTLKIRFHDFTTITRSTTLDIPVDAGVLLARAAKTLLAAVDPSPGVRLVGLSASSLTDEPVRQLHLTEPVDDAWPEVDAAVDAIRARFGDRAIGPAVVAARDPGTPAPLRGAPPGGRGAAPSPLRTPDTSNGGGHRERAL